MIVVYFLFLKIGFLQSWKKRRIKKKTNDIHDDIIVVFINIYIFFFVKNKLYYTNILYVLIY